MFLRYVISGLLSLTAVCPVFAQSNLFFGSWKGVLTRKDSVQVVFLFTLAKTSTGYAISIRNGAEVLSLPHVEREADSLFFEMPFFESSFRASIQQDGSLRGIMIKGTAGTPIYWPFTAVPNVHERFAVQKPAVFDLTGRWAVTFTSASGKQRPAIAEFSQHQQVLTGSFLTPSGDYRFLEGVVNGDSLYLSAFDGSHVYLFTARIAGKGQLADGWFYAGSTGKETWQARLDPEAMLPDMGYTPRILTPSVPVSFQFPDIDSLMVSLADERFRNKVVVLQLMGSWCPNCMDETRFLSAYYDQHRDNGVEVIALAYEYSTDFKRSRNSLIRFKDRFNVHYPLLLTGVAINDSLRTEKTLPNITPVKVFPTTLYLGRDHRIRKIETGFNGPGTGVHYTLYRKEFEETIDALLSE